MKHQYIALSYQLYSEKDNKIKLEEDATEERPFEFITGFGITLPAFEKETEQKKTGESFDFTIPADQAYGEYDPAHVIDIDRSVFTINNHFDHEHIYVDAIVPLQNEDGNRFMGHVLEITDDKVKMDLNHPLAGKSLRFVGKIIEAHEASDIELNDYIKKMEHHCGCGCDDCGEDGCGHCH